MNLVEIEMVSEIIDINKSVSYSELASAFGAVLGINEELVFVCKRGTRMAGVPDDTLAVCEFEETDYGDFPMQLRMHIWSVELNPSDKMQFIGALCEKLGCFALTQSGSEPNPWMDATLVRAKDDYQMVRMDVAEEGAVILEYL